MESGVVRARKLLGLRETVIPFVLRFIQLVDWEPGASVQGYNVDTSAGDERKWTHYDDSTGILRTESDSVTD